MTTSTTATTTATDLTREVRDLLQAYEVHHTGFERSSEEDAQHEDPPSQVTGATDDTRVQSQTYASAPLADDSPGDTGYYRRVPAYRPVATGHTLASRPAGLDTMSAAVVTTMFFGVYLTGVRRDSLPVEDAC
jgi:hypothetical protein